MTPLERAARALCQCDYSPRWAELGKDGPKLVDENWHHYKSRVAAVIEALREPSDEMVDAAVSASPLDKFQRVATANGHYYNHISASSNDVRVAWHMMTGCILEEAK